MESNQGRGSLTSRYLAGLLAPAVIAGVRQVTWPLFQHSPVLPYLLAVIFCAWYGGLGPGLLSVVVSFLLTDFFFIEPYFFFWFPKQVDLVRLLLFAVVGAFISVMSELMHRERRRAISDISGTPIIFSERVHADDLSGINAEVARCITACEPFAREFRVVWPDGNVHWVQGLGQFQGWKNLQMPLPRLACTSQPWASKRNPFGIHCASIHRAWTPTTRKKTTS